MNLSATGIKLVLVEFVIDKFVLVEFSLCTTQLVQISQVPKIVLRGDPLYIVVKRLCNCLLLGKQMDLTQNGKQCLLSFIMIICIANVIRNFEDTKKK